MKSELIIEIALGVGKLALPLEGMEAKSPGASLCIIGFTQF